MSHYLPFVFVIVFAVWGARRISRRIADDLPTPENIAEWDDYDEIKAEPVVLPGPRVQAGASSGDPGLLPHRRVKYLLDGQDGHRPPIDRVAQLRERMRGKGICSPR